MHRKQLHFVTLLRDLGREAEAYSYGLQLMKQVWDDEQQLQQLAGTVIHTKGVDAPNLSFALKGAARAAQLVEEKDPGTLSLLDEIQFRYGHLQEAVETQQKALALSDQSPLQKAAMEPTPKRYRGVLEQIQ